MKRLMKPWFWIFWSSFFAVWSVLWAWVSLVNMPRHPFSESIYATINIGAVGLQLSCLRYWWRQRQFYRSQREEENE